LSRKDVEEQLNRVFAAERKRFLVAFHGTGAADTIQTRDGAVVEVVPVRSELELRERVPKVTEASPSNKRMAFLVPFGTQIPIDLAGLFAKSGRVLRIGREARLKHLFGASELDWEVLGVPLADHLLREAKSTVTQLAGRRLTVEGMWAAWLEAEWNVPTTGGIALDSLLGWAATANGSGVFLELVRAGEAGRELRGALLKHLESLLGPAGAVIWQAWEKGLGERVLELALIFDALKECTVPEVGMWIRLVSKSQLGAKSDGEAEQISRDLGSAAGSALRLVEQKDNPQRARAILKSADEYPQEQEVRKAMTCSAVLPSAWRHRIDLLGGILAKGATDPAKQRVDEAVDVLGQLERHRAFKDEESQLVFKRAEMAVKLLAWLAAGPHRAQNLAGSASLHGEVESLGRWYAEEGGYVDWARGVARGIDQDTLGAGIQAVVDAADRERAELDLRFATALTHWYEAGRPANRVVPIDTAIKRIALKFLEENESRRLLVLLLDGMAWAQAVEITRWYSPRCRPSPR
jgi:hypothetical protein